VPGRPDATRQLEIRTPVAATSVRGTRFNVQVTEQGSSSAVDQGRVALQGSTDRASTVLPPGFGAAVDASGRASPPVPRLPAIATDRLSSTVTDAQWLALALPAVAQASAYQVQVSRDSAAEQVLRNGRFATPQVRFASLPDGDYWLHVQAQDALGISGHRAQAPLRVKAHPVA
ncbi:FecR domain-containing protein, partial [Bacillus cereus group sp. TH230-1LC]|nr:FecR domain-containing protein [Bacillus cereus group sp. TH230-1LC]